MNPILQQAEEYAKFISPTFPSINSLIREAFVAGAIVGLQSLSGAEFTPSVLATKQDVEKAAANIMATLKDQLAALSGKLDTISGTLQGASSALQTELDNLEQQITDALGGSVPADVQAALDSVNAKADAIETAATNVAALKPTVAQAAASSGSSTGATDTSSSGSAQTAGTSNTGSAPAPASS